MEMASIPDSPLTSILRLVLASVLGAAVGINRELRAKPAGLRTHALVSLGAALLTLIGLSLTKPTDVDGFGAASRVLQGLIAGVGFIGGGVILRREEVKEVHGLSTAASIWIVSAIGVAAGCGLWLTSTAAVVLTLGILALGEPLDRLIGKRRRDVERSGS
jgi:putative Mg2+ transporter-C (MgtC) family protein